MRPGASDLPGLEVSGEIVVGDLAGSGLALGDKVCALVASRTPRPPRAGQLEDARQPGRERCVADRTARRGCRQLLRNRCLRSVSVPGAGRLGPDRQRRVVGCAGRRR